MATARARRITALQVAEDDRGTLAMLTAEMKRRLPTAGDPSDETWTTVVAVLEALEGRDLVSRECGCRDSECCVSCCLFPCKSDCGSVAS